MVLAYKYFSTSRKAQLNQQEQPNLIMQDIRDQLTKIHHKNRADHKPKSAMKFDVHNPLTFSMDTSISHNLYNSLLTENGFCSTCRKLPKPVRQGT